MSVPSRTTPSKGAPTRNRRGPKGAPVRPNRAQQRAMEVRAAETRIAAPIAPTEVEVASVEGLPRRSVAAPRGRTTGARVRAVARPIALTRQEEYRFIRNDMRRMIVTASGLIVLMIALLFLFEG